MALETKLDGKMILAAWLAGEAARKTATKRWQYYAGKQAILGGDAVTVDGSLKIKTVTNFIEFITDTHTGFLTSKPATYTQPTPAPDDDTEPDTRALDALHDWYKANDVDALDVEHLLNCILLGSSVEAYTVEDSSLIPTAYDPRDWVMVRDVQGRICVAIYQLIVKPGQVLAGEIQTKETERFWVVDDETTQVWQRSEGATSKDLVLIFEEFHSLGAMPVVEFKTTPNRLSHISDAIIGQQDAYNLIKSANTDDVAYNADALLATTGLNPAQLLQKDAETGKSDWKTARDEGWLPLNEGQDAKFLTKGNMVDKVSYELDQIREALMLMGATVDTTRIVGATGTVSGIALKLKFQVMIQQSDVFAKYFKMGLRDRIDLLNALWLMLSQPVLEDYDVTLSRNLPVNQLEETQMSMNTDDVLARADRLKLISAVENPVQAAAAKEQEALDDAQNQAIIAGTSNTSQANQVQAVQNTSESLVNDLEDLFAAQAEQRKGEIDKIVAALVSVAGSASSNGGG